ncbi:MAG TPA: type II toxin-antitoxin system VapC family toxin [Anaerolineae bacterium]|nr:type II toxin-antitoxin system VapC family toxin [Anaerolineae bacterium]
MNLLLDTHVFLWFISGDARLPDALRDSIRDSENEVYVSVVSLWEAMIKHQLGKLPLPQPPEKYLPLQRERHRISSLSLDEASVSHLAELPPVHRDPFDRMLICQAMENGLTFVTVDDVLAGYPVSMLRLDGTHSGGVA